jgi:hypothetical protein
MAHAAMGMLTGQNDLAYPVFSENFFQISAVESAIEAFRRNDFPLRSDRRKFVDNRGTLCAGHGMAAPDADLPVI